MERRHLERLVVGGVVVGGVVVGGVVVGGVVVGGVVVGGLVVGGVVVGRILLGGLVVGGVFVGSRPLGRPNASPNGHAGSCRLDRSGHGDSRSVTFGRYGKHEPLGCWRLIVNATGALGASTG